MRKIASILLLVSMSSLFAIMPPMPPSFGAGVSKAYPQSCKALPRMLVFLPPPMEIDFIKCKNDLNMPLVSQTTKILIAKFGKGISEVQVSLAKGFYQLYRVDFFINKESKTIFVNSSLTKFIDGSILNLNEDRK